MRSEHPSSRGALVLTIGLALLAPAFGHADHFQSDPGARVVEPNFTVGPELVTPGQLVNLTFQTSLPDRQNPIVRVSYILPAEWRFAVGTIRPGNKADGTPADSCAQVQHSTYDDADVRQAAQPAPRAEPMSVNEFLQVATTRSRETEMQFFGQEPQAQIGPGSYPNEKRITFGRRAASDVQSGRLVFLRWDEDSQTATLCQYLHSRDGRLDRETLPGVYDRSAREHLIPISLRRMADDRWEIALDYRSLLDHPYLREQEISVTNHYFEIPSHTYGNWQGDCSDTDLCPANTPEERAFILAHQTAFNRAPAEPGEYDVRARYTTCSLAPVAAGGGCEAGTDEIVERVRTIVVAEEDPTLHTVGRLVSQGPPNDRYYIALGNTFDVLWRSPDSVPGGHEIKGYLVTIARPNREETQHFEYLVVDPVDPAFDPRQPCGPDGDAGTCILRLSFPLPTITPGEILAADGKYVISLITIYTDGHRTDGRCDDGTARGAPCPPSMANFGVETPLTGSPPGIDFKELLIRDAGWPQIHVQTVSQANGVGNPSVNVPAQVLFVDYALRRAELVIWNWNSPEETSYFGGSNTIIGDDGSGIGLVHLQVPPKLLDHVTTVTVATTGFRADGITLFTDVPLPGGRAPSATPRLFQGRRTFPFAP